MPLTQEKRAVTKEVLELWMGALDKIRRDISLTDDPALQPADALANLETQLYDRLTQVSAASAIGVDIKETEDGRPFPVVTTSLQGEGAGSTEAQQRSNTGNPSFRRFYLGATKRVANVPVSSEMVTDNYIANFGDVLTDLLARAVAREIDQFFFTGSGSGQPQGLAVGGQTFPTGAGAPGFGDYFNASFDLDGELYTEHETMGELRWVMNPATFKALWTSLVTSNNAAARGAQGARVLDLKRMSICSFPVVLTNRLPALGASPANGTAYAMFGNFRRAFAARIVKEVGTSTLSRQAFTDDQAMYRVSYRYDGRVKDANAIRVLTVGS